MKDRTPHLCRNALGTAICASNGIGPSQDADRRIEHCVICGRWWKIYAVSPYLTICRSASLDDLAVLAQNLEDRP